jgi:hypothetical protein
MITLFRTYLVNSKINFIHTFLLYIDYELPLLSSITQLFYFFYLK